MTFIELLSLWFAIGFPIAIGVVVAKKYGLWPGIGAGLIAGVVCISIVIRGYLSRWKKTPQRWTETKPPQNMKE